MISKLWTNSSHLLLDHVKMESKSGNDEPTCITTTWALDKVNIGEGESLRN